MNKKQQPRCHGNHPSYKLPPLVVCMAFILLIIPLLHWMDSPYQGAVAMPTKDSDDAALKLSQHFDNGKNKKEEEERTRKENNARTGEMNKNIEIMVSNETTPVFPRGEIELARVARELIHAGTYGLLSTLTKREGETKGHVVEEPFGNIVSYSASDEANTNGTVYFYMTPMDVSVVDLETGSGGRCALTVSAAMLRRDGGSFRGFVCGNRDHRNDDDDDDDDEGVSYIDEQDPRCARVILTGRMVAMREDTKEEKHRVKAAKKFLFKEHPQMRFWPSNHHFSVYFMAVDHVYLLHAFGGMREVDVEAYRSKQASPMRGGYGRHGDGH
eukprot:Nk52_evm1s90 gene=Nk52_evmTU1s90